jgi:methyl-accepting chemotaxis protein
LVAAVKNGDPAALEAVFVREFKALKTIDPTVASMEATDAKGVVIIRGHNPTKKGDDKGKLPQIKMALSGQATGSLTVSPTSGEAAEDSVFPIKLDNVVIGTLKVGSYFEAATAEELKKKTGLEVVFVAAGRVTETTFPKEVKPPAPTDVVQLAQSGAPASFTTDIEGTRFTGHFIHLPSDNGDGMTIGFFANRTPIEAAKSGFLSSLSLKGVLALAGILPIVLWLTQLARRQLLHLAAAMMRIADGDLGIVVPYAAQGDEVGVMAKAVEVFKANAIERTRLEAERDEAGVRAATERKNELQRLADDFQAAVGSIVHTVSSTANELEAAASKLTDTAETTQRLSATVAHASEDASFSVQSVAWRQTSCLVL